MKNFKENIEKERNKKARKNAIENWWYSKGVKIFLFWLYYPVRFFDNWNKKRDKKVIPYSDEITEIILQKEMPKWDINDTDCIIFDNDRNDAEIYLSPFNNLFRKSKHKKVRKYGHEYSAEIYDYIVNRFEIEGYRKIRYECNEGTDVKTMFGWEYCYSNDGGVVFVNPEKYDVPTEGVWKVKRQQNRPYSFRPYCSVCKSKRRVTKEDKEFVSKENGNWDFLDDGKTCYYCGAKMNGEEDIYVR